jgi:hypothetical protein
VKFAAGVPYHLKVRTGFTTSLPATQGRVALTSADDHTSECVDALELPMRSGAGPYQEIDHILRACGSDAVMTVSAVRGCGSESGSRQQNGGASDQPGLHFKAARRGCAEFYSRVSNLARGRIDDPDEFLPITR